MGVQLSDPPQLCEHPLVRGGRHTPPAEGAGLPHGAAGGPGPGARNHPKVGSHLAASCSSRSHFRGLGARTPSCSTLDGGGAGLLPPGRPAEAGLPASPPPGAHWRPARTREARRPRGPRPPAPRGPERAACEACAAPTAAAHLTLDAPCTAREARVAPAASALRCLWRLVPLDRAAHAARVQTGERAGALTPPAVHRSPRDPSVTGRGLLAGGTRSHVDTVTRLPRALRALRPAPRRREAVGSHGRRPPGALPATGPDSGWERG